MKQREDDDDDEEVEEEEEEEEEEEDEGEKKRSARRTSGAEAQPKGWLEHNMCIARGASKVLEILFLFLVLVHVLYCSFVCS